MKDGHITPIRSTEKEVAVALAGEQKIERTKIDPGISQLVHQHELIIVQGGLHAGALHSEILQRRLHRQKEEEANNKDFENLTDGTGTKKH